MVAEPEVSLPFGPPPVLPDVTKQLQEYLLCPDRLPIHDYRNAQDFWPRVSNPRSLYHYDLSPIGTTLKVERDPTTGRLLQFREVSVEDTGSSARNSLSFRRAPAPTESVKGDSSNFPFIPGGFPDLSTVSEHDNGTQEEINFEDDLLTVAPGLDYGIDFMPDGFTPRTGKEDFPALPKVEETKPIAEVETEESEVNLMNILQQEEHLVDLWKEAESETKVEKDDKNVVIRSLKIEAEDLKVIPEKDNIPVLKITETAPIKQPTKTKWAEAVDVTVPVSDFHQKIPDMAHKFPFELDNFQKQAILRVERHENVFVAAHTSAGKTVVAEYAIALSRRHMTRTVYTSPIKALSNQKYRDFKETFQDVGLITGDFQINQKANCLIMTTEILRSMLYHGSEAIRDLEFVIFDEVHYINDAERGYVWEEVLILLPQHVTVVMLSATVPNTLQFADWVGNIKQKKIYVISTLKRPVPLTHYLHIPFTKLKTPWFLILDADRKFNEGGYYHAVEAMKPPAQPAAKGRGGKQQNAPPPRGQLRYRLTFNQETTLWVNLLQNLEKEKKLPVIAFTLSRKRCDTNAENLKGIDFTTEKEKWKISQFFQKCLQKLKEPDRILPQVVKMQELLQRGIGIHHSGILPILKEIVEMLFQKELVKLLFATETFAMGVNMPARTVVFDAIRKFDGKESRDLQPAEYIQMAGRAGRRGLDATGTVIIICKTDVPTEMNLKNMMLGSPKELVSKFRLTYSMILRLLRVEKISVEDMMSRSFMESGKKQKEEKIKKDLQEVESKLAEQPSQSYLGSLFSEMAAFYDVATEYIELLNTLRVKTMTRPKVVREMVPGRVLLISHKEHVNKLALLLSFSSDYRRSLYKVLVLCDSISQNSSGEIRLEVRNEDKSRKEPPEKPEIWYRMMGLIGGGTSVFVPDGVGGHAVLAIGPADILEISDKTVRINVERVIQDWDKRQLPRFRDAPVGESCNYALQELLRITHSHIAEKTLFFFDTFREIAATNMDDFQRLHRLKEEIKTFDFSRVPHFEKQFENVFARKELERKREHLKFSQSHRSMTLFPEYEKKVKLLQKLKYIDANKCVELKGRVAIKMRNHELMITELVLRNILTNLRPAEIAAVLSSLVFEGKTDTEPKEVVAVALAVAKQKVMETEKELRDAEISLNIGNQDDESSVEELNFGLMEVVYEWAMGKPFAEIMEMTDVQEGIIVRCIQRLNDTLRDVKDAATMIGDTVLCQKMEEAANAIKRDIVFAASLYTSGMSVF
ncbi:helicase SKI2W [Schistocerca piceifrons]|uniref:helicase SKI2W n=1 Tax=Schistocerca piceifrons TaxID=274613 RepID=UPI001F5F5FE2|nr:helicase SKI2W [Schistocerca piceifrons]